VQHKRGGVQHMFIAAVLPPCFISAACAADRSSSIMVNQKTISSLATCHPIVVK